MHALDHVVVGLFLLVTALLGLAAYRKVHGSRDFFVGGGQVPWWLAGISHHVSGHSGVVFVAYAAIAYEYGFTIYVWWAGSVAAACFLGAWIFAPRWARLRIALNIESPTEYLARRYSVAAQQLMAWCGALLKLFDVGAKWAALGILLHGFTGLPIATGILLSGGISLLYITVGGLWADLYTDLLQFLVQVVAGIVLLVAVVLHLGGVGGVVDAWSRLPAGHSAPFNGPYTPLFLSGYLFTSILSYNGGTWNLAARYIAAPSAASARRSAVLSGWLYVVWPLMIFFPMWLAPLLLPDLADPSQSYIQLTRTFLPVGMVGLVLASMFAATMAMTTSDTNTVSAVVTRDILPLVSSRLHNLGQRRGLLVARLSTFGFTLATLLIAIEAERFGGILGLIISWFAALVGPVSVPMLLGLLPAFRHADARAAIITILAGLGAFAVVNYGIANTSQGLRVGSPIFTSLLVYTGLTWCNRHRAVAPAVEELMQVLNSEPPLSHR